MIEVKIEFLGTFSSELKELERTVTLREGTTMGDLIRFLQQELPQGEKFGRMVLDEQGNKRQFVLLMLNYKLLYRDPLDVKVPDRAKVVFAMPAAGG